MSARSPILAEMHYNRPSAFTPENLFREARRQKSIAEACVPAICVLDPDGDVVRRLKTTGGAQCDPSWACTRWRSHLALGPVLVGAPRKICYGM